MEAQVAESIIPFPSSFPFEVMVYIIASLDLSSQAAFSLTSHEYNDEVDRFLWESITIDPSLYGERHQITYVHDHCDALLRVPRRAGYIRTLNIYLQPFPVMAIPAALIHISRALTVLTGLIYLNCGEINPLDQEHASLFFSADRIPFRLESLAFENIDANMPSLRRFLASQPDITRLKLWAHRDIPCIPDFPISTLPNLQHISANLSVVEALAPHRPIASATLISEDLSIPRPTLSILSQSHAQILELDLHTCRYEPLDEITKLFPNLRFLRPSRYFMASKRKSLPAFPELQVLWCEIQPHKEFYTTEEFATWTSNCPSLHTVLFGTNYPGPMRVVAFRRFGRPWIAYPSRSLFYYDFGQEHYVFPKILVNLKVDSTV